MSEAGHGEESDAPGPFEVVRDELLTPDEVAAQLKVTTQTVKRYRKGIGCGELGPFPPPDAWAGTHPRWYRSTVDRWSRAARGAYSLILRFKLGPKDTLEEVLLGFAKTVEKSAGAGFYCRRLESFGDVHGLQISWPRESGLTPELLALVLAKDKDIPYLRREAAPPEFYQRRPNA